jgi:hypothetical protein
VHDELGKLALSACGRDRKVFIPPATRTQKKIEMSTAVAPRAICAKSVGFRTVCLHSVLNLHDFTNFTDFTAVQKKKGDNSQRRWLRACASADFTDDY